MTASTMAPLNTSREQVRAKETEIGNVERDLLALYEQRESTAVAGERTRDLRAEIAEGESELEDLRSQLAALRARESDVAARVLDLKRHRTLERIYRDDAQFLAAREGVFIALEEVTRARKMLANVVASIEEKRGIGGNGFTPEQYPRLRLASVGAERLGISDDPSAPAPLQGLNGRRSDGGDTIDEVRADIERIDRLMGEHRSAAEALSASLSGEDTQSEANR
jgi:hypothetical protein